MKKITSRKYKYIFFPSDMEVYEVNPYSSKSIKKAFSDNEVKKWIPTKVIIGEDLMDISGTIEEIQSLHDWYIADDSVPNDHTFNAVLGVR